MKEYLFIQAYGPAGSPKVSDKIAELIHPYVSAGWTVRSQSIAVDSSRRASCDEVDPHMSVPQMYVMTVLERGAA